MVNLTIRNLSASQFQFTHTTSYTAPPPKPDKITAQNITNVDNLRSNFTNLLSKSPIPGIGRKQSPPKSVTVEEKTVNVKVDGYSTNSSIALNDDRNLKLRFDVVGTPHKFEVEVPARSNRTELEVRSLSGDTKGVGFIGVFHKAANHLAIVSTSAFSSWMAHLPSSVPLSLLSIPGTHNSPTHHRALPSVRCQAVSVTDQLNNGVRFLDIRVQPESDGTLTLVHGAFPISLTGPKHLHQLLDDCYKFLSAHNSETLVLSIKREGRSDLNDEAFSKHLFSLLDKNKGRWNLTDRIPTLGEARGKCLLFRRFNVDKSISKPWGIPAETWKYNCAVDTRGPICVQDFCEVAETENIDLKIKYVQEQLDRSAKDKNHLYINFASASNFWKVETWPEGVARKVMPKVEEWLCTKGQRGTGVLVLDFVGENGNWTMVKAVVGMNTGLEVEAKRIEEEKKKQEEAERKKKDDERKRKEEEEKRKRGEEEKRKREEEEKKRREEEEKRREEAERKKKEEEAKKKEEEGQK